MPSSRCPAEVKASLQEDIDYLYGIFVDTVARNRA
jgi:ClpP class serine protease